MSDRLLADLVKWYRYEEDIEDYMEIEHPSLDQLIVYEEQEMKKIFASKGKGVIFVRYDGDADTDTLVDEIERKLMHISSGRKSLSEDMDE